MGRVMIIRPADQGSSLGPLHSVGDRSTCSVGGSALCRASGLARRRLSRRLSPPPARRVSPGVGFPSGFGRRPPPPPPCPGPRRGECLPGASGRGRRVSVPPPTARDPPRAAGRPGPPPPTGLPGTAVILRAQHERKQTSRRGCETTQLGAGRPTESTRGRGSRRPSSPEHSSAPGPGWDRPRSGTRSAVRPRRRGPRPARGVLTLGGPPGLTACPAWRPR